MNIRLLRGQVVVREDLGADTAHLSQIIIPELGTAEERQRARKWHRGVVLAKGAPMLTTRGVEVPHGFEVGDIVVFHWIHRERSWTREWVDGKLAAWIPQAAIDAVIEPEPKPTFGMDYALGYGPPSDTPYRVIR